MKMDSRIWDNMATDYDKSVEDNQNPVIVQYLERETDILAILCKNILESSKNCTVIDMGSGTGRMIFALDKMLQNDSVWFYGVEVSEPMLNLANQKRQNHKGYSNIRFLKHDLTEPGLADYFKSDTTKVVMCLYNTLGVIPSHKRQEFVDTMISIAGDDGMVIITAFNGDDVGFVAPKLYHSMIPMIRQIDEDSFDKNNRVFQNGLGFHSQWFTQTQLQSMLDSDVEPVPINVVINGKPFTFGNVFAQKSLI